MGNKTIAINFICLGNICRSPLAEGVFRHLASERGLLEHFEIDSSGTSGYHQGEPPDPGSVKVARANGIDISHQRSRQLVRADLSRFDHLVAMDTSNRRNVLKLAGGESGVRGHLWLMRNFEKSDTGGGHDVGVPDPWGGGPRGFEEVYRIVRASCSNFLDHLVREHDLG